MKNFLSILFEYLLLTNLSFTIALETGSFHPIETFKISGNAANNFFGFSVSSAGDIDNDGYDDIIIGAYYKNSDQGAAYVIYGGEKSAISNWDFSAGATLDPLTTGFMITGNAAGDSFGYSVSTAGDINNDGYDDIIIGANTKNSAQGAAYVIYGGAKSAMSNIDLSTTTLNPTSTGFMITGNAASDRFGCSVSSAGDINNDGYDDIIVGAMKKNSDQGAAYVIYGGDRATRSNIVLSSTSLIPTSTGFMMTGNAIGDSFGYSVSTAGDINNDGYDDIIVGAYAKNTNQGAAYVIYGGDKATRANIALSSTTLNPTSNGFMITGSAASDRLGFSVSDAGDVNKDGYDDIIVGASGGSNGKGAAYVIYGGPKTSMSNWDFISGATLNPTSTGFMITGDAIGDNFGISVSTAGDVNNDGYDDIIAGAYTKNSNKGAAYVIYGGLKSSMLNIALSSTTLNPTSTGFMITGNAAGNYFGRSVSTAGDVNNDGYDDIIIGAHMESPGVTYLILNQCSENCETCDSHAICKTCSQGWTLVGSTCSQCPTNCETCSSTSSCDACAASYFLYQGQCVSSCPPRTFALGERCQDCPEGCSACSSSSICGECLDGYTLTTELLCQKKVVEETTKTEEIEEKDAEKIAAGVFEGTSLVGASLSSGSSLPFNFGIVAKILRNFKYMALPVSRELQETFVSWKVASGFMSAPDSWSEKYDSKTIPTVFSRYGLQSAFLLSLTVSL